MVRSTWMIVSLAICSIATAAPTHHNPISARPGAPAGIDDRFVDGSAAPGGDGLSWATAYTDLQQALADSAADSAIRTIHVAEGTYHPDAGTGDRAAAFILRDDLELLGGYPTGGGDRDPDAFPTTLSADLAGDDPASVTDNTYNIVVASGVGVPATVDGFTVVGGNGLLGGGGLFALNGSVYVRNTRFLNCRSIADGGAVTLINAPHPVAFDACTFDGSFTTLRGGAVYLLNAEATFTDSLLLANECGLTNNSSSSVGRGGAIYAEGANLTIERCELRANDALHANNPLGGAVYASGSDLVRVIDCDVIFNRTRNSSGLDGVGGGLWVGSPRLIVEDSRFDINEAVVGGALFHLGGAGFEESEIERTEFTNNSAVTEGAGVSIRTAVRITDCSFDQNTLERGAGAGAYLFGTSTVESCSFFNNTITGLTNGSGGGLYLARASVVESCFFDRNVSELGGGCYDNANSEIRACTFVDNRARQHGGGLFAGFSGSRVIGCTFEINDAFNDGGAISTNNDALDVRSCSFEGNSAADGGAIGYSGTGTDGATILSSRFVSNTASDDGGAVYGFRASGSIGQVIANCVFINNTSSSVGGAVAECGGTIVSCTFAGNSAATTGGLDAPTADVVTNCVFWANSATPGISTELDQFAAPLLSVNHCLIEGLQLFVGSGNIGANPGFVDPLGIDATPWTGDEDLRLLPGSPAIDAGDSSLLPHDSSDLDGDGDTSEPLPLDLDGNPRVTDDPATTDTGPVSPAVDLGAYEFQPAACVADLTGDGVLNFDDIDAFVAGFLAGDLVADLDGNGVLNFDDIDAFIAGFLAGC